MRSVQYRRIRKDQGHREKLISIKYYQNLFLPGFNVFLRNEMDNYLLHSPDGLIEMLYYHLGWDQDTKKALPAGKRLRPFLVLLASEGAGIKWEKALPAAAAVELVHNFSLIHDDIEDKSDTRRGRQTIWRKWGIEQAVNAGDAMLGIALSMVFGLGRNFPPEISVSCSKLLHDTVFKLTCGQYYDLLFEDLVDIDQVAYTEMIAGKTAALFACSTQMGAILGSLHLEQEKKYRKFGHLLGLAFQIYDDWLGIWGDERKTGKPSAIDLIQKKKTYPVILGLTSLTSFRNIWTENKKFTQTQVNSLIEILESEGVKEVVKMEERKYYQLSEQRLVDMKMDENIKKALSELMGLLLDREE